jgi:hypothetical protein
MKEYFPPEQEQAQQPSKQRMLVFHERHQMLFDNVVYCGRITFEVKLPSACSFIVDGLAFCCRCSHYMFRPTWPSSGVYDNSLFITEGICFAAFVAFVACCYSMQFLICVCLLKTKNAHKNMEINGNTTNKHKLETA